MMSEESIAKENHKQVILRLILLSLIGLAVNLFGAQIASALKLPIYCDFIGTAVVAAIGGPLPGIIIGLLTNILRSITDPVSVFYGTISVINAVVVAFAVKRKWLKKIGGLIVTILILAAFGGGLGSVLTWMLYGFQAEPTTAGLVGVFYSAGLSPLAAEFWASIVIDILDKGIVVTVVVLVLHIMPKQMFRQFQLSGLRQAPLSPEEMRLAKQKLSRSLSLRTKLMLMISIASLVIATAATVISFVIYRSTAIADHKKIAESAAIMAANIIDGDRVDEYLEKGEAADGYQEIKKILMELKDSAPDISYVYAYRVEEDGYHVVFDIDTEAVKGDDPGTVRPVEEDFLPYLPALLAGQEIEPVVCDDSFGLLLTDYEPVYDSNGVVQCYAGADVEMKQIQEDGIRFLAQMISLFLAYIILVLAIGFWMAEYDIVLPVNAMTIAATAFERRDDESMEESVERIKKLDIRTGDEIENLYHAFSRMTEDNLIYLEDIERKNDTINEMQAALILVLADMVESRDKNTGDHVRKTAAYTKIIMEELKKEGKYTDQLTDEFISDVVYSAPLHDVGKINVPDAILNKPGKLSDEEFDKMKTHTTVGGNIIDRVIDTVPESDSGYLQEAKRLALYHHEKWNGAGYPTGLAGEEIPLSARIMAVADVFDALVSTRSYKKGFPFEKAMDIIRESSGTHFDPDVAQAFLNAEDEVRKVAEEFGQEESDHKKEA